MVICIMFYLYISVNDGVPKTKRTNNFVFEHILIFLNENKGYVVKLMITSLCCII